MKKKLLCLLLVICLITPCGYFGIKAIVDSFRQEETTVTLPESMIASSCSYAPDKDLSKMSSSQYAQVEQSSKDGIILSYSTQTDFDQATTIALEEKIDSLSNISENVYYDGQLLGKIEYEEGNISSVELAEYSIYYDYDDKGLISTVYSGDNIYSYDYENGLLKKVYLNDQLFTEYQYNDFGKVVCETYPILARHYEYTNASITDYIYDYESGNKILFDVTDLLNEAPYEVEYADFEINSKTFNLPQKVTCGEDTLVLDYDYLFEGVPYVTKTILNDETFSYAYIDDMVVARVGKNEKITYIYSSTKQIVGLIYGKVIDGVYYEGYASVTADGLNNVVEVSAIGQKANDNGYQTTSQLIENNYYSSFGKLIAGASHDFSCGLGYNGGIAINQLGLTILGCNIYSSLTGRNLLKQSTATVEPRILNELNGDREDLTRSAFIKAMVIERSQDYLANTLETSSMQGASLYLQGEFLDNIDIFTSPATIDGDNILKNGSQAYIVVSDDQQEAKAREVLDKIEMEECYVSCYGIYKSQAGKDKFTFQFIFLGILFTVDCQGDGIIYFTEKADYSSHDFVKGNIFNFDTNRYVQYQNPTISSTEYLGNIGIILNYTEEDLNELLEDFGIINTSVGQTYRNANFGDSTNYLQLLLSNNFTLNLPEFDEKTQYIAIEDGQYVVKDIPEGSGLEADYNEIKEGISDVVQGVLMVVGGAVLCVTTCGFGIAMICGVVAIATGVYVTVCGIAEIRHGATGYSYLIDTLFKGDRQLFNTVKNIAVTVGTIAIMIGSMTIKSCFVAGTEIATVNGVKNIEDIQTGDLVLSYNEKTKQNEYKEVKQTFSRTVDKIVEISYNDNIVRTTLTHPFYIENEWVEAQNLHAGDKLTLSDGTKAEICEVEVISSPNTEVYNFEVDDNHTYYVEDEGVLVHNACGTTQYELSHDVAKDPNFKSIKKYYTKIAKKEGWTYDKLRNKIWSEYYKTYDWNTNPLGLKMLSNKELLRGKSPIINATKQRIEFQHVFGKAVDPYTLLPMTHDNHFLFHKEYGFHYNVPKLPWPKF